jgi:hypothetical protein
MSLDNIQLPPIAVQQLFRKSLVELKTTSTAGNTEPAASINILGKNQKGVLVIVKNSEAAFLQDDELNFLLGILSACRLNMDDVGIVNLYKYPGIDYKKLSAELNGETIVLFGVDADEIKLPLAFPFYQVQKYNNQTYLSAPLLTA